MKYPFFTFLICFVSFFSNAQDTTIVFQSRATEITAVRKELITAFSTEDFVSASLWIDSLRGLENLEYVGLVWDERWLLYYWTESYGNLFEEVAQFNETQRAIDDLKNQPAPDSLFQWIDQTLYARRFEIFQSIQKAFLNEEEKAFANLLLEYLLRLEHDESEWASRIEAFIKRYPTSRFNTYLAYIKPHVRNKSNSKTGFGIDLLLTQGTWRGELERTLRPSFGIDFGITLWHERWNYMLRLAIGGQKLGRDIENNPNDIWPKGESSNFFTPTFDLGYDIISTPKFRFTPTVGGGLAILKPPTEEDDEGNSISEYPTFGFTNGQLNAALNLDVKLHDVFDEDVFEGSTNGYGAIRARIGYRWMNLGKRNYRLDGGMIFFSIGYSLLLR